METAPQRKIPKLTKKQLGFVKDYVLSGNGQQAAMNNYEIGGKDPENTARSIASENLTKPNVMLAVEIKQQSLKSALEKQGITPQKIAEKVDVLLTAVDKEGNTDYTAVDKGLKHATNIYGIIEPEGKSGNTYNFILNPEVQSEVKKIEAILKAKLIQNHVSEN